MTWITNLSLSKVIASAVKAGNVNLKASSAGTAISAAFATNWTLSLYRNSTLILVATYPNALTNTSGTLTTSGTPVIAIYANGDIDSGTWTATIASVPVGSTGVQYTMSTTDVAKTGSHDVVVSADLSTLDLNVAISLSLTQNAVLADVVSPTPSANLQLQPFSTSSDWKTLISGSASYAAASNARTVAFRNIPGIGFNVRTWTQWIWYAKSTDPLVTFYITSGPYAGRTGTVTLRMPANAHPDPATANSNNDPWGDDGSQRDAHLMIMDPNGTHVHEFYHAQKQGGTGRYEAWTYVYVPLAGLGTGISGQAYLPSEHNDVDYSPNYGSVKAYGGSGIAGVIRAGEVVNFASDPINHALCVAVPHGALSGVTTPFYVRPASSSANWPNASLPNNGAWGGAIRTGERFAIPSAVNLNSYGFSPGILRVANALQDYGAYVVDQCGDGVINFYSEGVAAQADGDYCNARSGELQTLKGLLTAVDNSF